VLEIVAATRRSSAVVVGASPRAAQALYRAAQAHALVDGLDYVLPRHVKVLAVPVLAHRLQLQGGGDGDLDREEGVMAAILEGVRVPV
jgi:MoxR-like ATPase